eukprot:4831586-Pyramimonas_sp.AAC.1
MPEEALGGSTRPWGSPGKPQDVPGDPGRPQVALDARRIGERKMCAAPERERNFQKACARRRSGSD